MDKLIQIFQLFSLLIAFGISFSQPLCGQKITLSNIVGLVLENDIFGGSYEYISDETIVPGLVNSGVAGVIYKAVHPIKLKRGFKVGKNCRFKGRLLVQQILNKVFNFAPFFRSTALSFFAVAEAMPVKHALYKEKKETKYTTHYLQIPALEYNETVSKSDEDGNSPYHYFKIYPKVSSGIFYIHQGFSGRPGFMAIYNTSGRLIFSTRHLYPGATTINLSGYLKGAYLVKANIDNTSYQEKIVLR